MISRQPQLHVALRITAAVTVVFWLLAASYCSVEHLFGFDHHASATASEEHAHHDAAADIGHSHETEHGHGEADHPHDDAEGDSHGSHHHDGEGGSCCSTLHATAQLAKPLVIATPLLQPLKLFCVRFEAAIPALTALEKASARPPPNRDWVFTPEVCPGPANRSHAPPASA